MPWKSFARSAGERCWASTISLHDAMNWSDVLVGDVSAVLSDYLVTGKPIVLCNVLHRDTGIDLLHTI